MTSDQIITLIKILIIIAIIWALIKQAVKVALAIIAIVLIFKVGFIFTGDDLNERFQLNRFLKDGKDEVVVEFFNDFRKRGNGKAIIDQEEVYNAMLEGIEKGVDFTIDQLKNIDIDAFAENLAENIYEAGAEAIDSEELEENIEKSLEGIDPETVERIVDLTIEKFKKLKND